MDLHQIIKDSIDSRLATAGTVAQSQNRWSLRDHANLNYVPNDACWVKDINLSGLICSYTTSGGTTEWKKTAALITPRCVIFAAHYQLPVGAKLHFKNALGQIVTKTMTKKVVHPHYKINKNLDLCIGLLDEAPEGCTPLSVLPKDYETYFPDGGLGLPVLQLDQIDDVGCAEIFRLNWQYLCQLNRPQSDPKRIEFHEYLVGGDSSDQGIMLVENNPILLTVWRYGGAGVGCAIHDQIDWVDKTCKSLADEETFKFDLSNPRPNTGPSIIPLPKIKCSFSPRVMLHNMRRFGRMMTGRG